MPERHTLLRILRNTRPTASDGDSLARSVRKRATSWRRGLDSWPEPLAWLNPAAVVVPKHPTERLEHLDTERWEETISMATYVPLAKTPREQNALLKAYHSANTAKVADDHHLTPRINLRLKRRTKNLAGKCFRCVYEESTKKIHLFLCGSGSSVSFPAGHYNELYTKAGGSGPIFFRPLRGLRFSVEEHHTFLVGAYLRLSATAHSDEEGVCACNCLSTKPDDLTLVENLALATYLEALEVATARLRKEQEELSSRLDRHRQVLALLREPLDNLASALQASVGGTQTLHNLLYSPARGLFAAAPNAQQFFVTGRDVKVAQRQIRILHNPGVYNDIEDVAFVLAAVLCAILPLPKSQGSLDQISPQVLGSHFRNLDSLHPQEPRSELSALCKCLVGDSAWAIVISVLAGESVVRAKQADLARLRRSLNNLKDILDTPYKDDKRRFPLLPLAVAVLSDDSSKLIITKEGQKLFCDDLGDLAERLRTRTEFQEPLPTPLLGIENSLPVASYAAVLELLSGVVAYAADERTARVGSASLEVTPGQSTILGVRFTRAVFTPDEVPGLWEEMTNTPRRPDYRLRKGGDFTQPFLVLTSSILPGVELKSNGTALTLQNERGSLQLSVTKNELKLFFRAPTRESS